MTRPMTYPHAQNKSGTIASWNGTDPVIGVKAYFRPDNESGNTTYVQGFEGYTLGEIETYARNLLSAAKWLRNREDDHRTTENLKDTRND